MTTLLESARRKALILKFQSIRSIGKTPAPRRVYFECTMKCNMNCTFCYADINNTKHELNKDEVFCMLSELSYMGVKELVLTGGEPMLRKDLFEILQKAKDLRFSTGMITNGYFIDDATAKKLSKLLEFIEVSVDAIGRDHDNLRNTPNAYDKAINAMQLLKKNGLKKVGMATVIIPKNMNYLNELYKVATENAAYWHVSVATGKKELYLLRTQMEELAAFLKGKQNVLADNNLGYIKGFDNDFSLPGFTTCCIGSDGKVRGHPTIPVKDEFIEGDITEKSFVPIWANKFNRFRYPKLDEKCNTCNVLGVCLGGDFTARLDDRHCHLKKD